MEQSKRNQIIFNHSYQITVLILSIHIKLNQHPINNKLNLFLVKSIPIYRFMLYYEIFFNRERDRIEIV